MVAPRASRPRRSLGLGLWYCVGHGLVIVLLATLVGLLGVRLPGGLRLGVLTGAASIGVGAAFVLEKSAALPALLSG